MRITVLPRREVFELDGRRRAGDMLRELGFLPGTAMVIRGEELVPEHEMLGPDDVIEVRSVISGGLGGLEGRPRPGSVVSPDAGAEPAPTKPVR
jgi:sulfur carrier protein ThiS